MEPVHIKMIILKLRHSKIIFMLFASPDSRTKKVTAVLVLINTNSLPLPTAFTVDMLTAAKRIGNEHILHFVSMCLYMSNMFTCYMCVSSLSDTPKTK